ncbi:uncharacterized protein LOC126681701 [Mercurialis annua]|uniref:uncharacterized protein LOC126681701 n=1 Tax=Mercurialis annua TaxID=3986 RepID=UPI0024AD1046|nr:uncharacterized protein LOC126681701 [Mercurialis annua]
MATPTIPKLVVLQSHGSCLQYVKEGKHERCIKCDGNDAADPASKFEIEQVKDKDLVHIRCCYNNKYLRFINQSSHYIGAAGDKVEEDPSKWSCTLFKPMVQRNMNYLFQHVQSGNNLCHFLADGKDDDHCLIARLPDKDEHWELFHLIDWKSLVILPKHVVFKGDNGKYLQSLPHKSLSATLTKQHYRYCCNSTQYLRKEFNLVAISLLTGICFALHYSPLLFSNFLISNLSRTRRRFLSSFPAVTMSSANNATAKDSHTKDEVYLNAVIEERIKLFSLLNGTVKEGERQLSTSMAKGISKSLATNVLIAQLNGWFWDMNRYVFIVSANH